MRTIKIKVTNFDEHNEKAVGKILPWLRLQTRLARSSKFLQLSPGAKHMWLWLLCESAQSSSRVAHVSPRDVSKEVHVKPQNVLKVCSELVDLEWIQILSGKNEPYDMKRTNETNDMKGSAPTSGSEKSDPPPPSSPETHWLMELWNQHCGTLPKADTLGPVGSSRRRRIPKQLKGYGLDREYWAALFERVSKTPFCTGWNDRSWCADFDWVLQTDVPMKILAGKYDRIGKQPSADKRDFMAEAHRVLQAIRQSGASEDRNAFVGPDIALLVKESGGWYQLGQVPRNDFTTKTIAGLLKASAEMLKNKPTPGGTHE